MEKKEKQQKQKKTKKQKEKKKQKKEENYYATILLHGYSYIIILLYGLEAFGLYVIGSIA